MSDFIKLSVPEFSELMLKEFPVMLRGIKGSIYETNMAWGIEVPIGWRDLVYNTLKLIQDEVNKNPGVNVIMADMKEKYASLRIYYDVIFDDPNIDSNTVAKFYVAIDKIIYNAENKSTEICEICAKPAKIVSLNGWQTTLCLLCHAHSISYTTDITEPMEINNGNIQEGT